MRRLPGVELPRSGNDLDTRRWWGYVGACSALLVALGPVSVVTLDARWAMAEMSGNEDAMALSMPPSLLLILLGGLYGAGVRAGATAQDRLAHGR